ncbi:MAG: aspartate aminotransferase family protein [Myxococcales bacterium]|nr:MAG: aspartate aminotransferase family protein [Myxococcales bacterium]
MLSALPQLPVYEQYPMPLASGRGCTVVDEDGVEYLDMYGGHAVALIGHSHPELVRALSRQAERLMFYSNAADLAVRRKFCQRLLAAGPDHLRAVFLSNSGAEANENALLLARRLTNRKTIVSVEGGFHGRTLLTLSISGIEKYRRLAEVNGEALFPHRRTIPLNDVEAARQAIDSSCAAVILEPVQGIAGARPAAPEFLAALKKRVDEVGALLILDEVQCGSGRCDAFTVAQATGVRPHILTLAKGLAGGFPIGATLVDERVASLAEPGLLGSTFGGGPLACAAGLATLAVLERDGLIEHARRLGETLRRELSDVPGVEAVSGRGFLIGIRSARRAKEITARLLAEQRIIAGGSLDPQVVRIMPPLTLSEKEAAHFVAALRVIFT